MKEQQFIDDVILPEAERLGVQVKARLHERFKGGQTTFAIIFTGPKGERCGTPLTVDPQNEQDAELVQGSLSKIKQFIETGVVPDGCYVK